MDSLNALKDEGLIDVLGASNWSLDRFKEANSYSDSKNISSFGVLSNKVQLNKDDRTRVARMFKFNSDEDFKNYLNENQITIFPWSSRARGFS